MNHPENREEEKNKMNLLVWQGTKEIGCGGDFIIPDTKKDIKTVLWSEFRLEEQKPEAGDGSVTVKGSVTATVVYLADDGTLSYCVFSFPCAEEIPAPGVKPGNDVFRSGSVTDRTVKTINSRKVRISAKVRDFLFAYSEEETVPVLRGLTASGQTTVKERRRAVKSSIPVACRSVSIPVSADIGVPGTLPAVGEIVGGEMSVTAVSAEAEENAVRVTYENRFSFLCRSENGSTFPLKKKTRQTETAEVPGCLPGDRVLLNVSAGELRGEIGEDAVGEKRVLEADAVCSFSLSVFRDKDAVLTSDLYSTVYPTESVSEREEKSVLLLRTASGGYSHNVSFPKEECGAAAAVSVADTRAFAVVTGTETDPFREKLIVNGRVQLFALTVGAGEDGSAALGLAVAESPFRCELDSGAVPDGDCAVPVSVSVADANCRMDNGKLYFDTELSFTAPVFSFSSCRFVKEAVFSGEPAEKKDLPSVILCYPGEGETLWEIAKRYRSSTDALLTANRMTEGDLPKKTVLLIPTDAV
ncbi:MAG: DUF3794 domain-containing protein [Lachnospiraceae bacterium]|nr:DUF3794 domain-containing protein [Lachnospiraceae bacterium]